MICTPQYSGAALGCRAIRATAIRLAVLATFVASAILAASAVPARALVLIFDPVPIIFDPVDQAYGDRVTMTPQGGDEYGTAHGFTPNVEVAYGPDGAQPKLYTTGYGELVNVLFEDLDGFGHLEITLSADPTWEVVLHGFDLAAFSAVAPIEAVRIRDGASNELFAQSGVPISSSTRTTFGFDPPLRAPVVIVELDTSNLGSRSDDVGIDNIAFGQEVAPVPIQWLSWGGVKHRYGGP